MQGKDAHWAGSPRPCEPYPKRLNLLLLRQNHRYQPFSIVFLFPYRFPTAAVPRHFHDHRAKFVYTNLKQNTKELVFMAAMQINNTQFQQWMREGL